MLCVYVRDPGSEQTGLARTSSKSHPDPSRGFGHGQEPGDGYGNGSHDHAGIGGSDANGQGSATCLWGIAALWLLCKLDVPFLYQRHLGHKL